MVEAEGVEVKFTADDKDVNTRLDNLERRLGRAQDKAKKGGKAAGAAFFGGFAGGVTGVIAGAVEQTGPVSAVMDLLMNVLGAALLPLLTALLPVLKGISDVAAKNPNLALIGGATAAGAYVGGPVGAVAGGSAAIGYVAASDTHDAMVKEQGRRDTDPEMEKSYNDYIWNLRDKTHFWEDKTKDYSDYDKAVYYSHFAAASHVPADQMPKIPAQDPGRPYDPAYPPPNVGELHGPTVVNSG